MQDERDDTQRGFSGGSFRAGGVRYRLCQTNISNRISTHAVLTTCKQDQSKFANLAFHLTTCSKDVDHRNTPRRQDSAWRRHAYAQSILYLVKRLVSSDQTGRHLSILAVHSELSQSQVSRRGSVQ